MSIKQQKIIKWSLFIFCFSLILFRLFQIPIDTDTKGRSSVRGDSYSDANVHSAAKYFYHHGFSKTAYLPVYGYEGVNDTDYVVYTHYPALPDLLGGVYAHLFNSTNPQLLRIFPTILAVFWFFMIFKILKTMLPNQEKAFVSACIIVSSNYFIAWADTLHKHTYEEAFKWLFVYCLFLYYERFKGNNYFLAGLFLFLLVIANISFEPIAYLAVVVLGFALIYQRSILTKETFLLGTSAVMGFGLHFGQVVMHFGSFEAAKEDFLSAAIVRTTGNPTSMMNSEQIITWIDYLMLPVEYLNKIERFFLVPGWAFLILAYLGLRDLKIEHPKIFRIGLVLLMASIIWPLIMPQHFIVHIFTTKQVGLFYGFIIGYGLYAYARYWKEAFALRKPGPMAFHLIFVGYILVMMVTQQVWDLYIRYGFGFSIFS